jgi:outer membrane protein assembly factor BamB
MERLGVRRLWAVGVLLVWFAGRDAALSEPLDEQPAAKLPGESAPTARRLAEAHKRVEKEQWADAVEEYQRILDEAGDDLVPLDLQKPRHCVQARWLVHAALAKLPSAGRVLYQKRVDEQAKKWLDEGSARRDPAILRRLVNQAFVSSHTDQALDLLGDLALERGDPEEAGQCWRMLAQPASTKVPAGDGLALVYPDPKLDVAQVRAKQIMALLVRGDRAAAVDELRAFEAKHAKAEGYLAGQKGNLAGILRKLAAQADEAADAVSDDLWATLGGDSSRSFVQPHAPKCRWLDEPWRVRLDDDPAPAKAPTMTEAARACAFYPVIAGELVLVADARAVTAFDLVSGRKVARCDLDDLKNGGLDLDKRELKFAPRQTDARFTLTVHGNRVYARLGASGPPRGKDGKLAGFQVRRDSFVVCLQLPPKDGRLTPLWQIRAAAQDNETVFFEGSPLVRDGRAYLTRTRYTNDGRVITVLGCHHADTGALLWELPVCDSREPVEKEARSRHHLLTLAGPRVVCCTHSGAVIAADAVTGKCCWAVRYPRRGPRGGARQFEPCVYSAGRLFVAPADGDRILCLDAATGATMWQSRPVEVGHLLGVARGKLVFTTASRPRGIRALDAATGADLRGWLQPDGGHGELPAFGRGLFAGDWVLWPTIDGLRVLNQDDGQPAADAFVPLRNQVRGNLATARGCLIVATERELLGYIPEGLQLERRKKEAAVQPGAALPQFRLALALAESGHPTPALQAFARVETLAGFDDRLDGICLHDRALQERHQVLVEMANRAIRDKKWDDAAASLQGAAAAEFPVSLRLRALARLAELWRDAGQPERAVATWQTVLEDEKLRGGMATVGRAGLQPAGTYASAQIDRLMQAHGAAVYVKTEARSRDALDAAPRTQLQRLAEEYPNSSAVYALIIRLADQDAWSHRWRLRHAASATERALALARLARAYEAGRHWDAARITWNRLEREHGDLTLRAVDPKLSLQEYAAQQLKNPLYRSDAPSPMANLALPAVRAWHVSLDDDKPVVPSGLGHRALFPEGTSPSRADFFFVTQDHALSCRDATTGKERWTTYLGQPLQWLGRHGDLVLAGGPTGVFTFGAIDGQLLWHLSAADLTPIAEPVSLGAFHLAAGRLFFFQDERRLLAFDVETGQLLWNQWAPGSRVGTGGRFSPHYHADSDCVAVQSTDGQCWVLDSATGRRLHTTAAAAGTQPPVLVDERRLLLAPDAEHVALLDPVLGKEIWRRQLDRVFSLTGETPRLLGKGDTLLVLVARNYGFELQRLDSATGITRWRRFFRDAPDLSHAAFDATALYVTINGGLHALALADGRTLWDQPFPLTPDRWQVIVTQRYLLLHPAEARPDVAADALRRRWLPVNPAAVLPTTALLPLPMALSTLLTSTDLDRTRGQFPIAICDPKDGRLIQRLNFRAMGTSAGIALHERSAVIVTAAGAWGLR